MAATKRESPAALVRAFEAGTKTCRGAEPRKMFGYPAVFVNGNMFAGLVRDFMVLRLKDADRTAFLELPGAKPFIAMKGRVMRQWAVVPPAMLENASALKTWLRKAHAFGRSLPPKRRAR
jgi:TfoX/Sxy family transcriptional regulator of competence genes